MSIYLDTVNCIVCGKEAFIYTGHVKDNNEDIIAGFCSNDCYESIKSNNIGCYGEYKEEMGKQSRMW